VTAAAVLLTVSGCAAWRFGQAAALARDSEPLQRTPSNPTLRLLIVGDSTGVGTGASSPRHSVAGRLAAEFPSLVIENRASDGARLSEVVEQLDRDGRFDRNGRDGRDDRDGRFDMVLVQAGGNDVIRLRGRAAMQDDVGRVVAAARKRADQVVLMPAGNVGNAEFFFPPVSWLMTARSRTLHGFFRDAAAGQSIVYVNLFQERADDPFVQEPGYYARDGLHPSDAGYRSWFEQLMQQADLPTRLAAARVPDTPR
jgi:lysophospholipase L1-like esterase